MAAEARRGCGFRKVGGLYLVSDGPGHPCPRLPFILEPCEYCRQGIVATRSLRFVPALALMTGAAPCPAECPRVADSLCPLQSPEQLGDAGLMLVSSQFYTPETFTAEATAMGISKRVAALPKKLVVGKTWVMIAYTYRPTPAASTATGSKAQNLGAALALVGMQTYQQVFHAFVPQRLELIVTPSFRKRNKKLCAWHEARGVRLVEVPDGDPDHVPARRKRRWLPRVVRHETPPTPPAPATPPTGSLFRTERGATC